MPGIPDITAEEVLRGMIRDRIGSTDPEDVKMAEELLTFMGALSRLQGSIDALDEQMRQAEVTGEVPHGSRTGIQ